MLVKHKILQIENIWSNIQLLLESLFDVFSVRTGHGGSIINLYESKPRIANALICVAVASLIV